MPLLGTNRLAGLPVRLRYGRMMTFEMQQDGVMMPDVSCSGVRLDASSRGARVPVWKYRCACSNRDRKGRAPGRRRIQGTIGGIAIGRGGSRIR